MQQDKQIARHCRCGDEVVNSLRRSNHRRGEGPGTALWTYMGILILLAGVIAYVICIALTFEITKSLTQLWLGLRKI